MAEAIPTTEAQASLDRALSDLPMLRALRSRHQAVPPLAGARIAILCPATVHFAALVGVLVAMGARVRWAASSFDEPEGGSVAAMQVTGAGVSRHTGRPWDDVHSILHWPDGGLPNLLVDYDGWIARLVHRGVAVEAGLSRYPSDPDGDDIDRSIQYWRTTRRLSYSAIATNMAGLSECTALGAARLRQIEAAGGLLFPAVDASLGGAVAPAIDRDHVAMDTLSRLLARLALLQIELFTNGEHYKPALHGFPANLTRAAFDAEATDQAPPGPRKALLKR